MDKIIKVITSREDYDVRDSAEYALSVEQVIDILTYLPKDAKMVFCNDNGYTFAPIRRSTFVTEYVETKEEEEERLRKEQEEEERTHWVCPNCNCMDNIVIGINGGYHCLECGAKFKKVIIKVDNE
jgi:ribosomal protein L37AE/L43A